MSIHVFAAGSLADPLSAMQERLWRPAGLDCTLNFGPSRQMRERIEAGERADILASANLSNPARLFRAGRSEAPVRFTGNELVLLVAPERLRGQSDPIEVLTDPMLHIGMSDPQLALAGEYTEILLQRLESLMPKEGAAIRERTRVLPGGPDMPAPPKGRNQYAWLVETGAADVFITYRSHAMAAKRDRPKLGFTPLPEDLAQRTSCYLALLHGASEESRRLARSITGDAAQAIFEEFGFETGSV